jgi:hypothetical protein
LADPRINLVKPSSCENALRREVRVAPRGTRRFLHTRRMGMSTVRQVTPERPAPAVYWRRRFVALIAGLSILALITWAFAGALGGSAPPGNPAGTKAVPGTLPRVSAPAGGRPSVPASHGHAVTTASGRYTVRACPAGDVVLSLFSSQASYSVRQTPQFEVDVVSTDSHTCTFDIGARHVLLQITDKRSRIWTSADCAEGQASLVTKLHRGIPTVVPISWDGEHSSPGCPVPGAPAPAGTYTAVASDGSSGSNTLSFGIG